MNIRFLGHAALELTDGNTTVLIDPYLTGNPVAAVSADSVNANTIIVTHGHGDHLGDTVPIAKRTGADVVAIHELTTEIADDGIVAHDLNLGGTIKYDWGWVKFVPAWHTSSTPKGTVATAAGALVEFGGKLIYHLGDTCLFSDLKIVSPKRQIDVAFVPIGGHYTMDRHDAVTAVDFINPKTVVPIHYNTFDKIDADVEAFKAEVESETKSRVEIMQPGDTLQP